DGIEIITRLWSGEPTVYRGSRLSVEGAQFLPRPLQEPRIPIWSAMLWPPAKRGPIRRAARCDGVMPFTGAPLTPAAAAQVRAAVATERGNDSPFDLCVWGLADESAAYAAAGVTWLLQAARPEHTLSDTRRIITAGPPDGDEVSSLGSTCPRIASPAPMSEALGREPQRGVLNSISVDGGPILGSPYSLICG
ncbi:MAG: LLM class flavin-dependent oxidoreductase, partial [Acidimicrobiales bacterium]